MTYDWNKDYDRFAIARNILLQIVDSIYAINNEVEFGVRLYGSQFPAQEKNCTDSRLLVDFNLQNVNQIKQSLKYVSPIGWSPIAYSLKRAAYGEINNTASYDYSIIFITDGGESCNGDICDTYLKLLKEKVSVTPYIIGLDKNTTLKTYYDCLGKYVSVLETTDIPKAVKLIVDENKLLTDKKKELNLTTVFSNSPVKVDTSVIVKKQDPPKPKVVVVKKRKADAINRLSSLGARSLLQRKIKKPIYTKVDNKPRAISVPIQFVMAEPVVKPTADFYRQMTPRGTRVLEASKAKTFYKKEVQIVRAISVPINFEIEKPIVKQKADKYATIRPFAARHRFVYAFQIPQFAKLKNNITKVEYKINFTPVERKVVVRDLTKPKVVAQPVGVPSSPNTTASREVIPNDETLVQVYFVNKFQRSKQYNKMTPRINVIDAKTKQKVTTFRRLMEGGAPAMQAIKAGTYNFVVEGRSRLEAANVRIDANNINKIFIDVTDGTLFFAYIGNESRVVKEFQAIVNPRFENKGKTVFQECSDRLLYLPATYYIEVNTLPPTKFAMFELDFGEVRKVPIAEPGFLQINNTNRLGKVQLLQPLNDKFARFHIMTINGNVIDQKENIQPGTYRAVFDKDPNVPALGTKTIEFRIRSNQTTQLLLE